MNVVQLAKQIIKAFGKDKVGQLSAAASYSTIFSLGPLLLVLLTVIGFIYGVKATQGQLYAQLTGIVGKSTASTLQTVVAHSYTSKNGVLALVIGVVGIILGATGVTSQLQSGFNSILEVVPDPKGGIKRTIYVKLKNVVLILVCGLLVAASLVVSSLIFGFGRRLNYPFGLSPQALEVGNNILGVVIFALLVFLIYRTLPDVKIPRRIVLSAAAIVALLFVIGKLVLGIIIARNGTASAYGAAAALVSLLLWIYYSSEIMFLGAEIIKVYGYTHSLAYEPKRLSLKRTTLTIDSKKRRGTLIEAWHRGFKKGMQ